MNILAVDDEPHALRRLNEELAVLFPDADIHGEQSGRAALAWVEALSLGGGSLSYAFLDIQMGGMTGLELARRVKTLQPDAALVFCTAYSQYALDAFKLYAKGYLIKPIRAKDIERVLDEMVGGWREAASGLQHDVRVQTFGYFQVFVEGKPLVFARKKTKELLAYLVDRHGAFVTTEQIALALWENAPYDRRLKNMATATVSQLKEVLREAGIEDILIKSRNHLAVDVGKIKCDAYDFERGDVLAVNSFRGEYLSEYSWAEFTTGRFSRMAEE